MKVTRDKTENSLAYLTVEIDSAEVEESMEKAYRRLVQTRKVPGFRVGKTPRAIFEKYYSRQNLLDDALEKLLPEAYRKAIEEEKIEPFASPQIEVTQTEPVIFKAVVPLKPVVKLGDYLSIRVAPEPPPEVEDKDIDEVVERLRHQVATWEPVSRSVGFGDLVSLDIESDTEGKPFINQKGAQYQAKAGDAFPVSGFAEELVGLSRDGEKEFELEFPADDPRTQFAGMKVKFKVKVTEVKEEKLPELNDDLAKQVGEEFQTLDSLRQKISANLKEKMDEDARLAFEEKALEAAVAQAELEFPEVLIDSEIHSIIDRRFRTRQELEAYLESTGKTEEELHAEMHAELKPTATTRVRRSLVLGKVAEAEKIEVTEAEIEADIRRMLQSSGTGQDALGKALNTPEARESIGNRLLTKKTLARLADIARGTGRTETVKEESK